MYCVFDDVITKDNALELLLAADTFQLTYLRRTCASFVTDTLSASNVFDVITLCDAGYANLFMPKVMRRSHQVIMRLVALWSPKLNLWANNPGPKLILRLRDVIKKCAILCCTVQLPLFKAPIRVRTRVSSIVKIGKGEG